VIYALGDRVPELAADCFVAPNASIIGSVSLAARASVWFGAVVRGDNDWIHIGEESNIQDNAVVHTDRGIPVQLGRRVTIGHKAALHGCEVGDGSLVGINAVVLDHVRIGRECIVGAGALLTHGMVVPDGMLVIGVPARVSRELDASELEWLRAGGARYVEHTSHYRAALRAL